MTKHGAMTGREKTELLFLAAVWGGSFLFMRIGVPELGASALMFLRVGLAALAMLPLVALRAGVLGTMWRHWRPLLLVGAFNMAIPFMLYGYAGKTLAAGFLAVGNASTPIWSAIVGWLWLRDRLSPMRVLGLVVSMIGILVLVWDKLDFDQGGSGPAVLAAVAAPMMYGVGANASKRYLAGVDALGNTVGNLLAATLILLPLAVWNWPTQPVSTLAWLAALLLSLVCTGVAYVLFYRLVASVGPTGATSVTFLAPVFGILWGLLFLGEPITQRIVIGAAIILAGTALAMGLVPRRATA
jgi:drug/metabolite transporter (DMT)-like permease